jgi:hypothetical protein
MRFLVSCSRTQRALRVHIPHLPSKSKTSA